MRKNFKRFIFMSGAASAALITGLMTCQAQAQTAPAPAAADDSVEVVITGTRIHRPNLKSNSPITTIDAQEIKLQGVNSVEAVLNRLPQFVADANENVSNGSDGTANINLRGLGSNRNLVLIDGQRMLPTLAVDVNFIPSSMVDRIDVLSGGASAVYGSDAISGVVNFVMLKHLNGIRFDSQVSVYQHDNDDESLRAVQAAKGFPSAKSHVTDGTKYNFNVAIGSDLADHRGNVSAYFGFRRTEPVTQDSRDYSACALNEDVGAGVFLCGGSGNHAYGRFDPLDGPSAGLDLSNAKDGSKTWVPNDASFQYNYAPTNYIQREDKRMTTGAFFNYKFTDNVEAYGSFMMMDDHTFSQAAPSAIWLGTNFAINCDNPLMSDSQKMALCGSTTSTADAHTLVGYRVAKGAPRRDDLRHTDYRFQAGLRGNFNDHISFDVNATQSQMVFDENYQNDVNQAAAGKAMQVVSVGGVPTCKSVVDGTDAACKPIDIFSSNGFSAEGYKYIYQNTFTHGEQKLTQVTGTINADLGAYGVTSPWADDGLAAVVGFEHRVETLLFKADALAQANGTNNADGYVKSEELFTELDFPIVQDKPGIYALGINAGYRATQYSSHSQATTGDKKDFSTFKVDGYYAPTRDIRFRASYNEAVRAPNISELFASQGLGNVAAQDPCSGHTPVASAAACAVSGVTAAEYGHITECPADVCVQQYGGNPGLEPEKAKTLTLGFVATPSFVHNLQVSLDYFNIEVDGYISTVDPALIIDQCVSNGTPFFCSQFHRDHTAGGILFGPKGYIISTSVNTGFLKTNGYDLSANYRIDTDNHGKIDLSLLGTYLTKAETQPLPGLPSYDCKGLYGPTCGQPQPKWRHNARATWTAATLPMSLSVNWRYFGGVDLSTKVSGAESKITPTLKAYNYIDLAGTYDIGHGMVVRAGLNNVFDLAPPAISAGLLSSFGNGNTYPGIYDPMGRMAFLGLSAKF